MFHLSPTLQMYLDLMLQGDNEDDKNDRLEYGEEVGQEVERDIDL